MTTETPAPRTEAGRSFLVKADGTPSAFLNGLTANVLAIEAEATRLALEGVAERVEKLPLMADDSGVTQADAAESMRKRAVALLSPAEGDGT